MRTRCHVRVAKTSGLTPHAIGIVAVISGLVERRSENTVYPRHTPRGIQLYPIRPIRRITMNMMILYNLSGIFSSAFKQRLIQRRKTWTVILQTLMEGLIHQAGKTKISAARGNHGQLPNGVSHFLHSCFFSFVFVDLAPVLVGRGEGGRSWYDVCIRPVGIGTGKSITRIRTS